MGIKTEIKHESFSSGDISSSEMRDMMAMVNAGKDVQDVKDVKPIKTEESETETYIYLQKNDTSYKMGNMADLPELQTYSETTDFDDFDDFETGEPVPQEELAKISDTDMNKLLSQTNFSLEILLVFLQFHDYQIDDAISDANNYVMPQFIPDCVASYLDANIGQKRSEKSLPGRRTKTKKFHLENNFSKMVSKRKFMESYYTQKNAFNKMENEDENENDQVFTEDIKSLENQMTNCGISLVNPRRKALKKKRGGRKQKVSVIKENQENVEPCDQLDEDISE